MWAVNDTFAKSREETMRRIITPIFSTLLLLTTPVVAQSDAPEPARNAEGEITDRRHPDYLKCRTESVAGSRAKKRKVCLTNKEWAEVARQGRGMATALVEGGQAGIDWEAVKHRDQVCQQVIC